MVDSVDVAFDDVFDEPANRTFVVADEADFDDVDAAFDVSDELATNTFVVAVEVDFDKADDEVVDDFVVDEVDLDEVDDDFVVCAEVDVAFVVVTDEVDFDEVDDVFVVLDEEDFDVVELAIIEPPEVDNVPSRVNSMLVHISPSSQAL